MFGTLTYTAYRPLLKQARQVVISSLYPQDAQGWPVYNPRGKYLVKIHCNGIERQVSLERCIADCAHEVNVTLGR
jgi:hypothetical protein